jgi:sarcosine oxidase subunit alpha
VNVPASAAGPVWDALLAAGVTPYGTEAMHGLRAEKGYVIVGQETDGTVTADDLGLSWLIGKAKRDFVGKRGMARPELARAGRRQLVGLTPLDGRSVPEEGAQLLASAGGAPEGHVTSAYPSAALGRPVALGLLAAGRARLGEVVVCTTTEGILLPLRVVESVAWDPKGVRLHG